VQELSLLIIYNYSKVSYIQKDINSKLSTGKVRLCALLHSTLIHSYFLSSTNW